MIEWVSDEADQQLTEQLPTRELSDIDAPVTSTMPYPHVAATEPEPPPRRDRLGGIVRHLASALVGAATLAIILLVVVDRSGDDGTDALTSQSAGISASANPSEGRQEEEPASASMATLDTQVPPLRLEPDSVEIRAGKRKTVKVLENDEAAGGSGELDVDTLTVVRPPEHARRWRVVKDRIQITADRRYRGSDSLTYEVCDDAGRCGTAEVIITIED